MLICQIQTATTHTRLFIETEFSSRGTAKNTWLFCQGYYYGDELAKIDGAGNRATDVAARKASVADSLECFLLGKPASDTMIFELHLSGVTLLISFRRSPDDFTVISDSNKHYRVKIVEANSYMRRITVADHELSATERKLLKRHVVYRSTDVFPQLFLPLLASAVGVKKTFSQKNRFEEHLQQCQQISHI